MKATKPVRAFHCGICDPIVYCGEDIAALCDDAPSPSLCPKYC